MNTKSRLPMLLAGLVACLSGVTRAEQLAKTPAVDEAELKRRYEVFLTGLDSEKLAADYPVVMEDLRSGDTARQVKAVKILGETGKPQVIPWLVAQLDAGDSLLRVSAGQALEQVISTCALQRRDQSQPDRVVLRPLATVDLDLRPLAWVALKMFRQPDDGSTHAYAATIARYLEAREFEGELRACLQSRHPAVVDKAKWALESLGLAGNASAQAATAETQLPAGVMKNLAAVIRQHCPEATIAVTDETFTAKHGTMLFTVHGHQMTGEIAVQPHQEEGPNFRGFLLAVSLERGRYAGQACVPQELAGPYFPTYIAAPATVDGQNHYWIRFSYGGRIDPQLKNAILEALPK